MSLCLTADELEELTSKRRSDAQARELQEMGIPYRVRRDGSLVVLRIHVEYEAHGKRTATYRLRVLDAYSSQHTRMRVRPEMSAATYSCRPSIITKRSSCQTPFGGGQLEHSPWQRSLRYFFSTASGLIRTRLPSLQRSMSIHATLTDWSGRTRNERSSG